MNLTSFEDLEKDRRALDLRKNLARIDKKYLLMSGKGGVGKTTLAVNLAAAKAARGAKVGLLDIDLHGPSVATALNIKEPLAADTEGKLLPFEAEHGLKVISIQGLLSAPDQPVIWRGPKKLQAINQFLSEVAWGDLDYLFIDAPPGTGDEPLAIIKTVPDLMPLMVTSGHRLSINDVAKAFNFLKAVNIQASGLIDNQSYLVCPNCAKEIDLCNRLAAGQLAQAVGVPLLASLPLDRVAAQAAEEGRPVVWRDPDNLLAKMFYDLAGQL